MRFTYYETELNFIDSRRIDIILSTGNGRQSGIIFLSNPRVVNYFVFLQRENQGTQTLVSSTIDLISSIVRPTVGRTNKNSFLIVTRM